MRGLIFRVKRTGATRIGYFDGDIIRCVTGSLDTFWQMTDETYEENEIDLLAPCVPRQIICVNFNYRDHAAEFGAKLDADPSIFSKSPHTVIGTGANIICPKEVHELSYGAELAVIVKRRMKNVAVEDVPHYIAGYTCANDLTATDLRRQESNIFRCKSFDTFCPMGPWVETQLDPSDLGIRLWVNGVLKQDARTSSMTYSPYRILSFISRSMTLDAGDVILTGSPAGTGLLEPGDEVTVEIEGIGKLTNRVVMEK